MKLWGGRFELQTDKKVEDFSSSIEQDRFLWSADLLGSEAHARMLGECGIITQAEAETLIQGLRQLRSEIEQGQLQIDLQAEDIHSFIEVELFKRVGDVAKKIHTARSRNDQVATDMRIFLRQEIQLILKSVRGLQSEILKQAESEKLTLMPGLTHFQHAQPVSLAHHLMAYFWMLERDAERLHESQKRVASLPLGAAALAGTGFSIDRKRVQELLGFDRLCENSMDAVSDRDFVIEFLSSASLIMMHLSRFAEEVILWSSPEINFVELGDEVTTGSSIMPQKKNPDVAELIRGKVGRVYGSLMGSLTLMKGLPLAYNRDLQEDKFHLLNSLSTTKDALDMTLLMLQKAVWKRDHMRESLVRDFSNATDLADELVQKGLSFREAHAIVGKLVRACLDRKIGLEDLTLAELQGVHAKLDQNSLAKLNMLEVLKARESIGGTAPNAVQRQIEKARALMNKEC